VIFSNYIQICVGVCSSDVCSSRVHKGIGNYDVCYVMSILIMLAALVLSRNKLL